jgi:hypothetical protein
MVPVPEYDDTSDGSKYNIKLFDDVGVGVGVTVSVGVGVGVTVSVGVNVGVGVGVVKLL